jgi:hypothetical protein
MQEYNEIDTYYLDELKYTTSKKFMVKNRLRLILRLYTILGFLIFIIGGLAFLFSFYELKLTQHQITLLILSGVGFVVGIAAKFYMDFIKERQIEIESIQTRMESVSNFILNWSTLERSIYKLTQALGLSISKFAIVESLAQLHQNDKINNKDLIFIEKALDLRNKIVHGQLTTSKEEINRYTEKIEIVTDKIINQIPR